MAEFSSWLEATRKAMGFRTNTALAEALGIPQPTVSRWKSGAQPSVEHLAKLSDLFGVSLKTLLVLAGHLPGQADGPEFTEGGPQSPEGMLLVSRDDLRSALLPAIGQDPVKLTDAILRLREACGLDDPDEDAEIKHGRGGYRRGCRCEECREANRVHMAASRARRVQRGKEDPSLIPHGLGGYRNWGCRCETCTWANSTELKERGRG